MVRVRFLEEFRVASNDGTGPKVFAPGEHEVEEYVARHHAAKDIIEILDKKFAKEQSEYTIEPPSPFERGPVIDSLPAQDLNPQPFVEAQNFGGDISAQDLRIDGNENIIIQT